MRLYEADVTLVAIQQNLGHADTRTALRCIGTLDANLRRPPALFTPPHVSQLNRLSLHD